MPPVTGVFNATFNPAQLNMRSFNHAILRLYAGGSAPLFALTAQTKKGRAVSATHGYFTKTFNYPTLTMGVAAAAAAATLTVAPKAGSPAGTAATAGLVPGMIFEVPATRELIKILTVPTATTVTVVRAYGRIAAGAIGAADIMSGVGNAHAEGSNRPVARAITTSYVPNYTQIFRNAWAVTDTARASLVEAGYGNVTESRKDMALMHAADMESALFFGQPQMITAGVQPEHTTQGIIDAVHQYAPNNVKLAGATTNYTQLVAMLESMFAVNSDMGNARQRVAFVGSTAMRVLNDIGRLNGVVEITSQETTFGLQFNTLKFYKGTIRLIEHPMFNDMPNLASTMVVVDLPAIRLAYMEGRDAKVEEYGVGGKAVLQGQDSVGGSLTSEFACECINPATCGIITGFTAGA